MFFRLSYSQFLLLQIIQDGKRSAMMAPDQKKEKKMSRSNESDSPALPLSKASTLYPALQSMHVCVRVCARFSKTLISAVQMKCQPQRDPTAHTCPAARGL